jgi:hypothetical protein
MLDLCSALHFGDNAETIPRRSRAANAGVPRVPCGPDSASSRSAPLHRVRTPLSDTRWTACAARRFRGAAINIFSVSREIAHCNEIGKHQGSNQCQHQQHHQRSPGKARFSRNPVSLHFLARSSCPFRSCGGPAIHESKQRFIFSIHTNRVSQRLYIRECARQLNPHNILRVLG